MSSNARKAAYNRATVKLRENFPFEFSLLFAKELQKVGLRLATRNYLTGEDRAAAREQARKLRLDGENIDDIAKKMELGRGVVYDLLRESEDTPPQEGAVE